MKEFREDTLALEKAITKLCGQFIDKYAEFLPEIREMSFTRYDTVRDGLIDECSITVAFGSPLDDENLHNIDWSLKKASETATETENEQ